jgi:N-acetylglucosaminyl-diphospho-decaprenol L-rhamnosyltransferase
VEVVIVHRDSPAACANSVTAFLAQPVEVNVTVVDNASSASALAALRDEVAGTDIVVMDHNAGFGPAANVGVRRWLSRGEGDWVVVAPHDAMPEPDCLRRLVEAASSRPGAGFASAEFGPSYASKPVLDRYLGGYVAWPRLTEGWEDADYPHGTLLLARRQALDEIGLFDERYFAYCEEADLGARARRAGWGVGIVWGAVVSNPIRPETRVTSYLQLRNTLLLVRDHFGRYPAFIRCCMALLRMGMDATRPRRSRRSHRREEGQAIRDFLKGRFGPPPSWVLEPES